MPNEVTPILPILRIKDDQGNWVVIPGLKGPKGDPGDPGPGTTYADPNNDGHVVISST